VTFRDINPLMITIARDSRGLLQQDLASRLGISQGMMSKIESQEALLNEGLLRKLAKTLNYREKFFFHKGEYQPTFLNYRRRQKVSSKILTPIDASINVLRISVETVLQSLGLNSFPAIFGKGPISEPRQAARDLRRIWKIPSGPIRSIVSEIESHGIIVLKFDFKTERVDSRTILTRDNIPIIVCNASLLGDRQRFSIAYELGHIALHAFRPSLSQTDIGHEANLFASEFLMPEAQIKEDLNTDVNIARLGELKLKWRVSMQALLYRANDLGIISDNQKKYLVAQFNKLGIRRREPKEFDISPEENESIFKLFEQYVKNRDININDMIDDFGLTDSEFTNLFPSFKRKH
jgi:Zn-dependent peptidase ImmA (M78 family)/transcriptional regulator with XRE-family HTH domain